MSSNKSKKTGDTVSPSTPVDSNLRLTQFVEHLDTSRFYLERAKQDIQLRQAVDDSIVLISKTLQIGKPVLICGNGGSMADSLHWTGELVGRYQKTRPSLRVISLGTNPAYITAWSNDIAFHDIFSREVEALGEPSGIVIGITTSGRSKNILQALKTAKLMNMHTIALCGNFVTELEPVTDIIMSVPCCMTPMTQQIHVCVYHYICSQV